MSTPEIVAQVFLWIAVLSGTAILIPQVVRMHKNKYADNSSLGLYIFYLSCNVIWTIYQILYIVTTTETDFSHKVMLWVQFGGDILQVSFGLYSLLLKIYYMVSAKYQKDNKIWVILKRRAEIALFLTKEQAPMRKVVFSIIKQYPNIRKKLEEQADKNKQDLTQYIHSKTAVELAVIVAQCFKKIINKKYNQLDINVAKTYAKWTKYIVNTINTLSDDYMDIINGLHHYRVNKIPYFEQRKTPKTKQDLDGYLTQLNLVDKWAFLSQIYQSLLRV